MNKGVILFLLVVPALIALGFDYYLYYENQEEGFKFTDLGWIWIEYHEASHNYLMEQVGNEYWIQYIVPILKLPMAVVALIFSCIVILSMMMIKLLISISSGRFSSSSKRRQKDLGRDRGDKKQFKYNRK